jgi:hypothetical protein
MACSIGWILVEETMAGHGKGKSHTGGDRESSAEKRTEKFGDRTVGRGMDSPDSSEAVLDASTAEPDPRAADKRARGAASKQKR